MRIFSNGYDKIERIKNKFLHKYEDSLIGLNNERIEDVVYNVLGDNSSTITVLETITGSVFSSILQGCKYFCGAIVSSGKALGIDLLEKLYNSDFMLWPHDKTGIIFILDIYYEEKQERVFLRFSGTKDIENFVISRVSLGTFYSFLKKYRRKNGV